MDSFNQHENFIKIDLKSTAKVNKKFITYFDNHFDCHILKIELLNSRRLTAILPVQQTIVPAGLQIKSPLTND